MGIFKIISLEEIDGYLGKIKKGDELNCLLMNNIREAKEWAYNQYGPLGENIKHRVIEVKQ